MYPSVCILQALVARLFVLEIKIFTIYVVDDEIENEAKELNI